MTTRRRVTQEKTWIQQEIPSTKAQIHSRTTSTTHVVGHSIETDTPAAFEKSPDFSMASGLLSDQRSRLEPRRPAKKFRTIWNPDYLKYRDDRRLLEEYQNSTSSAKEVLSLANKVLGKEHPRKKKEGAVKAVKKPVIYGMMETSGAPSSTKCVSNTHAITPTFLDSATRMKDSLPTRQQRRRMSTSWLYRHWLFKQESQPSASRRARKCPLGL
ncbi:hypothetical protein Aduo_008139 [Ancylostoma duodenale]